MRFPILTFPAVAAVLLGNAGAAYGANNAPPSPDAVVTAAERPAQPDEAVQLAPVNVNASADATAAGLSRPYAGGQVARGGRAGILGTRDNLETPFSITSYTNELIQDRQAKSVGDVLQADAAVRTARGFGNFQESYFIRGFILSSDDVSYNGLYSLLPRQYIATELFERVELLRGASAFLTGANPGGGGIGGAINLLPKRAPNAPLTRFVAGIGNGIQGSGAVDIARRYGPDGAWGIRVNAAYRDGGTAIDREQAALGLTSVGVDWRGDRARLSADIGYQDNQLDETRTNIQLGSGVNRTPDLPRASINFAQPWTYSNERDLFGTLRGEYDATDWLTAYAAYGLRRSEEENSLANLTITDADNGDGNTARFDNTREDRVDTGEAGLRARFSHGPVAHELVLAGALFRSERDNAFAFDFFNTQDTNLYAPTLSEQPAFSDATFFGNDLANPALTNRTTLTSFAMGDTVDIFDKRLLLTLGARHQTIKVENFAFNTGTPDPAYDRSRISPTFGVVVRVVKPLSLYANYIEGLTQGDTAPAQASNVGTALAPYVSKQREVGAKFDLGRIGGGAALFSTARPRGVLAEDGVFSAAGQDRHRGIELNVYGVATTGLRVLGGATVLDAEQQATGNAATDGQQVIGVPRFQANVGAEWDLPKLDALTIDARVIHTGDSYLDAANAIEVEGWTRLDAGVRYAQPVLGHQMTLRIRAENLTNERYYASAGGFPGIGYLVIGGPRAIGFTLAMDL